MRMEERIKNRFNTNNPPGSAVIVSTPESYCDRLFCASVISGRAFVSKKGNVVVPVEGFEIPQLVGRLTPLGEISA